MRPFSLRSARFALLAFGFGPMLLGCFDVEQVEVPEERARLSPRLIDNFDDDIDNSVRQPTDASFEPWRCFGVNGAVLNVRCDPAEGVSGRGRVLTYDLLDVPNGRRDYQGAELQTRASEAVDFSVYEEFVFSARFMPSGTAPISIPVQIKLYCSGLGNGQLDDTWVESSVLWVRTDSNWYTFAPIVAALRQAQWQKELWRDEQRPLLDARSCLEQVDAIGFYLQPDLPDGARAAGILGVDEIFVQ